MCFRAACIALLDAYGILDVPGCEAQIAGNTIELTKRILGVFNEAVQSKNLELCDSIVYLAYLTLSACVHLFSSLSSLYRRKRSPFLYQLFLRLQVAD